MTETLTVAENLSISPYGGIDGRIRLSRPARGPVSKGRPLGLLVVDEQLVVRVGVRHLAVLSDRIGEISEATTGAEAIEISRVKNPDLALIDPCLPDMMLADLVKRIREASPVTRIVVFAPHATPTLREDLDELGAIGLLRKDVTSERFVEFLSSVGAGQTFAEPPDEYILRRAADKLKCAPLTPREHEIIRRAARGESNAEIAGAIFLAPTTVKSYLQSALGKLGARNRTEAVFKLSELRLL